MSPRILLLGLSALSLLCGCSVIAPSSSSIACSSESIQKSSSLPSSEVESIASEESSSEEISSSEEVESASSEEGKSSELSTSSSVYSSSFDSSSFEESSILSQSSSSEALDYSPDPMLEPYIGRQYYLNSIGDIYSVWNQYRGDGVTIAVIDVGFNPDHEDFVHSDGSSKVLDTSASFTTTGSTTKTEVGKSYVVNMGESHGTFCAGVAAAGINGKGVVGIAPNADLMLLKTDLKPKSIAAAFKYAADNGAKVITISIGSYYDYGGDLVNDGSDLGTVFDGPVAYAREKGLAVISAAGNGGLDNQPTEFTFPGCVDGVIGVGGLAANTTDELWSGSSYNSSPAYTFCDVYAPAENMFGCCHYGGKKYDGGWMGTSFASPQVAGLAALYFQKYPDHNQDDFEQALYASCHKLNKSRIATVNQTGHGRIDAAKLLGVTPKKNFTVSLKANWSKANCYVWNSLTGVQEKAWAGNAMSKNGNTFTYTIKGDYDFLIFNNGASQSLNLALSSFENGHYYDLTSSISEVGCLVGGYRK